jgi:hypothetical protein
MNGSYFLYINQTNDLAVMNSFLMSMLRLFEILAFIAHCSTETCILISKEYVDIYLSLKLPA